MPISWNQLIESNLDRKQYRFDCPPGERTITLDTLAYTKGQPPGIHLFVTDVDSHERFWLYCHVYAAIHKTIRAATINTIYRITVGLGKRGKPKVLAWEQADVAA
jgi:hypothetical protein